MKRVTRNGVIAVAAVSGAMAAAMPAFADSGADGSAAGSPGAVSGNTLQLPVHVPVNVCGNTVNVVGILNPAAGNTCVNESDGAKAGGAHRSGGKNHGGPRGGAVAQGGEKDSPGVLSGNGVELPIHLPVNLSGNSVNVVGIGNPTVGNHSGNTSGGHPHHPAPPTPAPPTPSKPHPHPHPGPPMEVEGHPAPPAAEASLAHTGADTAVPAAALSAALLLGGTALYRRHRPRAER